MPGSRSQRFVREEESAVAVDGATLESQLLQRLEDQAAALSETTGRLGVLESAVKAERALREQLTDELRAERSKVQQLSDRVRQSHTAVNEASNLEAELESERARADSLAMRLDEAWAQVQGMSDARHRQRGMLGRRRA